MTSAAVQDRISMWSVDRSKGRGKAATEEVHADESSSITFLRITKQPALSMVQITSLPIPVCTKSTLCDIDCQENKCENH
jgi:hypothetical protein